MRRTLLVVLASVTLVACGSDEAAKAPAESTDVSATPEAQTLAETCPEIEAGLPRGLIPGAHKWLDYGAKLETLNAEGDAEARNALAVLIPPVKDLAADPAGMDLLDARDSLRSALTTVADRCLAVGSSALQ